MAAIARTPQDVLTALRPADWAELRQLVARLNAHRDELVEWVEPVCFDEQEEELQEEVPIFATVAEETIDFIYRCLTFRDSQRVQLADFPTFAEEFIALIRTAPSELSIDQTLTRISMIADNDHRFGDAFGHAFESGEIDELLGRLMEFRQQMAA